MFHFMFSQHNHLVYLQIYKDFALLTHLKYQRGIFKSHKYIEPVSLKIYNVLYIQVEAKEVLMPGTLETNVSNNYTTSKSAISACDER